MTRILSTLAALFVPMLAAAAEAAPALGVLDNLKAHALSLGVGLGAPLALVAAFFVAGRTVPGLIVGKLRRIFEEAKTSPWWRAADKPHRARFLLATFVFLEAEIPDAGEGQEVYDAFGAWAHAHARVGALPLGSAGQWSALARKGGDALDLELDAEILELGRLAGPPAPPVSPPTA